MERIITDPVSGMKVMQQVVAVSDHLGNIIDPATGSGGGGGGGAVTVADGADATQGAKADSAPAWYNIAASISGKLALLIAAIMDEGSHTYGYAGGQLTTDAWTLFGITHTKTYTYTGGVLTAESAWV